MCRLLPLWLAALEDIGSRPRFVLVHRHPQEVASSLALRNGFSGEKAACLWLDHNLLAERWTRPYPRCFLPYAVLLEDPMASVESIAEVLGLRWPREPAESEGEIVDFISPPMRHHHLKEGNSLAELFRFQDIASRLYAELEALSLNDREDRSERFDAIARDRIGLIDRIDPVTLEHLTQVAQGPREESWRLSESLRGEWQTRSAEISRIGLEHGKVRAELERLGESVAAASSERDRREQLLSELAGRLEEHSRLLEDLRRSAETADCAREQSSSELAGRLEEQSRVLEDLRRRAETAERARDRSSSELAGRLEEQASVLEDLRRQAESAERAASKVEMLWSSKPWRMYAAFGRIGGWTRDRFRISRRRAAGSEQQSPD